MPYSLEKVIKTIEKETNQNVFSTDIKKDEVKENDSFFIYFENAGLDKATSSNQFLRRFTLTFVTKSGIELDDINLIQKLTVCGLRFNSSEVDYGLIQDSETEVKAITFHFNRAIRVCI